MLTAGNGLQGQYFDSPDFTGTAIVRTDAEVNFNWGTGSPLGLSANSFSARWNGQIEAQVTEAHSFHVVANDGARLWVNGQLLIDNIDDTFTNDTATIDLISGRRYDIQLEYSETAGNAGVLLQWSSASQSRQVIPQEYLFAGDRGGISVQRFNGISGNAVSNLISDPQFPNQPDAIGERTALESAVNLGSSFGQRLAGFLHPPETGPYTFYISGDQSAELWLSNSSDPDDRRLIASVDSPTQFRQWTASSSQQSATVFLAAGQSYFIEVLHKESTGADHVSVGWTLPGQSNIEVVSGDYLSPEKPTVRGFAIDPNAAESASRPATYEITRTGPTTNALVVNYRTSGTAVNGVDYQPLGGSITIPAGADSVTLEITPITDNENEGEESVIVELLHSDQYEVGLKSERTFNALLLDDEAAPAGGTSLWNSANLSAFQAFGGSFSTVADPTFGSVIQATVSNSGSIFSTQLRQSIDAPVNEGDILFAEFYVRSVGDGDGAISAFFEVNDPTFAKSIQQGLTVSDQWTKVQIPFTSIASYAAGGAAFGFFLGGQPQSIQFADLKLVNYGSSAELSPSDDLFLNNINGIFGVSQTVPVSGQPFATAFEAQVTSIPPQFYFIQAQETNTVAVDDGVTLRYEFSIRATAGTNPVTTFVVQDTSDFSIIHAETIIPTSQWQSYTIDVPVDQAYSVGGLSTVFNLGFGLQTVQIGDFTWTELGGGSVTIDQLPSQSPSASYGGREANSEWRADADQRIQDERTSNATVNVVDANGLALEGAVVSLRQTDHAFLFGSAISAFNSNLSPTPSTTGQRYQDEINRLFNTAVIENSLKWDQYLGNEARGIQAVDFANDNDLYLRGHNIIWPSREQIPESVFNEYDARVASDGLTAANVWLNDTINARFDEVLNTFDGQIPEWDVVNEPFTNRDVMDLLGDQVLVDWFQRVRDFDPDIALALNDFNIFTSNGGNTAHRADFETWLGLLNDADLLDVIGVQSHFTTSNLTDIDVLGGLFTQYESQFGQTISVTEFDVATFDEQLQADYLRDYLTQSFSQSGVSQFVQWGFWEGAHFQPEAALYRLDFSAKPNGQAYEDLVFGNWWSDVRGTTTDGSFSADVFHGEYDVVVQYAGQTFNAVLTVDDSGTSSVSIELPVEAIDFGIEGTVVGRHVFYNDSGFDGNDASANAADDNAIATDKVALLPGQTATFENYTSFSQGINGIIIDADLANPAAFSSSDIVLATGIGNQHSDFTPLDVAASVSVRAGEGVNGSDRITVTLPAGSVVNEYLQISVLANQNTGLVNDDVFYFGNIIGESGNSSAEAEVDALDVSALEANTSFFALESIDNHYDFNRDQIVNAVDLGILEANTTNAAVPLITAPVSFATAPIVFNTSSVIANVDNVAAPIETPSVEPPEVVAEEIEATEDVATPEPASVPQSSQAVAAIVEGHDALRSVSFASETYSSLSSLSDLGDSSFALAGSHQLIDGLFADELVVTTFDAQDDLDDDDVGVDDFLAGSTLT